MKMKELRELGKEGLREKMKELRLELMKEESQVAIGTAPKNAGKMRILRRTIARINTVLSTEELRKI